MLSAKYEPRPPALPFRVLVIARTSAVTPVCEKLRYDCLSNGKYDPRLEVIVSSLPSSIESYLNWLENEATIDASAFSSLSSVKTRYFAPSKYSSKKYLLSIDTTRFSGVNSLYDTHLTFEFSVSSFASASVIFNSLL